MTRKQLIKNLQGCITLVQITPSYTKWAKAYTRHWYISLRAGLTNEWRAHKFLADHVMEMENISFHNMPKAYPRNLAQDLDIEQLDHVAAKQKPITGRIAKIFTVRLK